MSKGEYEQGWMHLRKADAALWMSAPFKYLENNGLAKCFSPASGRLPVSRPEMAREMVSIAEAEHVRDFIER